LDASQVPKYDAYLSSTGGPTLGRIRDSFGARRPTPLYPSADPDALRPVAGAREYDLGYLGAYGADRQPVLDDLVAGPARALPERRFVVAGPHYPASIRWPSNVRRVGSVPPGDLPSYYASLRYALVVARPEMAEAGHSPSARLFEAAACGTPVMSSPWPGVEEVFDVGTEVLVARDAHELVSILRDVPEEERARLGERARARVLSEHTGAHRATTVERLAETLLAGGRPELRGSPG
ncbi:MAG: CgeB family protein, partial [Methanobacteriota archaeon]